VTSPVARTAPLPDPHARPAPLVGTVVLAGVGLIGGSVGLGLQQRFLARRVVGFDHDPEVLDAAIGLGVIDEAHLQAGPWLADADLVVLAAPVRSLVRLAREIIPFVRPDCVVTDVGSAKAEVVDTLTRELRFVGGHPMAGSERIGVLNADAALLENAVWVLTPTPHTDPAALAIVHGLVAGLGAHAIEVDPALHDRLVATVSHMPYLAAVALTHLVGEAEDRELLMLLAAGGFRDLTRVASGSPRMSRDMVVANRAAVREAVGRFGRALTALAEQLDDADALLDAAELAKRTRDALPVVRRSLMPARYEVVIAVPDRPGELARITRALGDADVNVKDIEVLGIRETGGALRLAFASLEDQQRATIALRDAGYEARVRGDRNGG
jgi:prephenate dehydrogenase